MNKLKILIIGSGGREHAVGWKVAQSARVGTIYFAPGNAGTLKLGVNVPIPATDIAKLLDFAQREKIDLTLALPDDPLSLGIVDEFQKAGLRIFGPTKAAAQLESSKAFAKHFMERHGLPTAKFETFTDYEVAKKAIKNYGLPVVVKASGLALGKGVIIAESYEQARESLHDILVKKIFGEAGSEVVVEEFLVGPEISAHAFSDGVNYSIFPPAQDHKRVGGGDTGPNTGGMGTIAPLPFVSPEIIDRIEREVIAPTLAGMRSEGMPFVGVLFPGLILTETGPKILEFNARFGDPETESYMRLLESYLLDIMDACIDGNLDKIKIEWKKIFAATVMLTSGGYPGTYEKGKEISGIEEAEQIKNVIVFHSGTAEKEGKLITNGGRVLGVSATGDDIQKALRTAYEAAKKISFEGMQYRQDIGQKALLL